MFHRYPNVLFWALASSLPKNIQSIVMSVAYIFILISLQWYCRCYAFALSFVNSLCWAFCYVVPMNSPSLSNHRLLFGLATTKYLLTKLTLLACLYCSCLLFLVLSSLLAEHSCFLFHLVALYLIIFQPVASCSFVFVWSFPYFIPLIWNHVTSYLEQCSISSGTCFQMMWNGCTS